MKKIKFILPLFAALLAVGCSGKAGDPGAKGEPGAKGDTGVKGDTGAPGATGNAGSDGQNGTSGQGVVTLGEQETYLANKDVTTYGIVHKSYLGVFNVKTDDKGKLSKVALEEIQIMHQWAIDASSTQGVGTLKLSKRIKVGEAYFQLTGKAAVEGGYTLAEGETNYGVIEYTEATLTDGTWALVAENPKVINLSTLEGNTGGVSQFYAEAAIAKELYTVTDAGVETKVKDQVKSTNGYWSIDSSGNKYHLGWKGNTANFVNTIWNYGFAGLGDAKQDYKEVIKGDSVTGFTTVSYYTVKVGGVYVNTGCTWTDFATYAKVALKSYNLIRTQTNFNEVIALLSALPADKANVKAADKAKIVAARKAYDLLSSADKTKVGNDYNSLLNILAADEDAIDVIESDAYIAKYITSGNDVIPSVGDITESTLSVKKPLVEAARAAYDALSANGQTKAGKDSTAGNYKLLVDAENQVKVVEATIKSKGEAKAVIAAIKALPEDEYVTLSNKAAIEAARAGYKALTDGGKTIVNGDASGATLVRLQEAEAALAVIVDALDAKVVVNMIAALGTIASDAETVSDKIRTDVANARAAYKALSSGGQTIVNNANISELTSREDKISAIDVAKVEAEIAKIVTIVLAYTNNDKKFVTDARNAYDALSSSDKAKVSTYSNLTAAEKAIKDADAAKTVNELINAIGTVSSSNYVNKKTAIADAKKAYNALSDAGQTFVGTEQYGKIGVAETAYNEVVGAIVAPVETKLDAVVSITLTYSAADKKTVTDARTAYNGLSDIAKETVASAKYAKLLKAEADLVAVEAAKLVVTEIENIGEVTASSKAKIANARKSYDSLSQAAKDYVNNLGVLTAAESTFANLPSA